MAPCADNKITGTHDLEAIKMRQNLLKVQNPLAYNDFSTSFMTTGICTDRDEGTP